ncbi:moderate conductance mechanosensitive channel YbiO [Holospora obtusa F1]|uniref:Moderate conductance mechanosensitive channel YbiO n=1 Tax=Holospora obtusa F1 TaxID=1399147 RepID=W6TUR5_HOLOB|nr:mechanosensitive ion channel domain-containing protein [Holospora obtusa]ETZ07482.1 moderate conductance mechanosensitive channel YbiO [Holospora obtusa F1]
MLCKSFCYVGISFSLICSHLSLANLDQGSVTFVNSSSAIPHKNSSKETQRLLKDVKEAKQHLKKNQEQLDRILKRLQQYDPPPPIIPAEVKVERVSPLLMHLELFSLQLKRVIHNFFSGFEEMFRLLLAPKFDKKFLGVITWIVGIFLVSVLSNILLYQHFYTRLNTFSGAIGFKIVALFCLPILVYGGIGRIWSFKRWFLPLVSTEFLAYLPLYTYMLMAGYYSVWVYFSSVLQVPLHVPSAQISLRSFQRIFLIYFLSRIFKEILTLTQANALIFSTFSQSVAIILSSGIWGALKKFKSMALSEIKISAQKNRLILLASMYQWGVGLFMSLWLFFPRIFIAFFIPTMVTVSVLLSISSIQIQAYKLFLEFLWRKKNVSFVFPLLYQYRKEALGGVKILIYIVLLTLWGEVFQEIQNNAAFSMVYWVTSIFISPWVARCFNAALVGMASFLLIKVINKVLRYYVEDRYSVQSLENNFLFTRLKTMMAIIRTIVNVLVGGPALIFMISHIFGVQLKEWAASVGVAGFGLTFGLQNIVRDFITGFFIIFENNLMVGDEVDIDGKTGKVEAIAVRTVKIRSETGMLMTIPFGNIIVIGNRNKYFSAVLMNISVSYHEDLEKTQKIIEKAFNILKKNSPVKRYVLGNLEFRGVNEVTPYSVVLLAKIRTTPNCQDQVRRQFNRILKELFDEAGIKIPSPPYTVLNSSPSLTNTHI